MKHFDLCQPTQIRFGWGRLDEVGEVLRMYGQRCLLVTGHTSGAKLPIYEKVKKELGGRGVEVVHFDGVVTNPTTEIVDTGVQMAEEHNADVILGLGGGSSMDTAKAIAVGVTHPGEAWDYRLFAGREIIHKALPVIAVPTTSGTGSQVTPISVITNSAEKCKSALVSPFLYPRICIVDPELMVTVPEHITAATGFDAFTHAFESYIHSEASVYTDLLAVEAMRIIAECLRVAIVDGLNKEARSQMAWADTLAGICISSAGTTLPHGIGMAIGGHAPNVLHGEALSGIYPEFMRYTYGSKMGKFATLGRILNPELEDVTDQIAASRSCVEMDGFLREIGMWLNLKQLEIPEDDLAPIAIDSLRLPDYKVNPRVATCDEILEILKKSYDY